MIDSFTNKYFFLSNFYKCSIEYDGMFYPTSEHAYQASKCLNINDKIKIQEVRTPGQAKRLGRKIKVREDWDDVKFRIMKEILQSKFSWSPLRNMLVETNNKLLVEGNTWHDNIWGDCRCGRDECLASGMNKLGKILMEIRENFLGE